MGTFGGLAPFPRRFGGAPTRTATIAKSLQQQLAPKYDTADTSGIVYIRINALARVIAGAWAQNERLANQWDPARMTDFLERWERIFGLTPSSTDSLTLRRARVASRMALAGFGTSAAVYTLCTMLLGDVFVSLAHIPSASANVWTPSSWPMGQHAPPNPDGSDGSPDWFSTIAHLIILTQQPATMDAAEFRQVAYSVVPELDAILPAWTTFDIIKDGPNGNGFFLDDPHNLDFERFSS